MLCAYCVNNCIVSRKVPKYSHILVRCGPLDTNPIGYRNIFRFGSLLAFLMAGHGAWGMGQMATITGMPNFIHLNANYPAWTFSKPQYPVPSPQSPDPIWPLGTRKSIRISHLILIHLNAINFIALVAVACRIEFNLICF